jgi:hypothetical protein
MRNLILMVSLAVVGCGGCGSSCEEIDESATRCIRMRDRLVELSLADAAGVDQTAHRGAMVRALGSAFVHACESSVNAEQVNCVLGAADSTAAMTCVTATDR